MFHAEIGAALTFRLGKAYTACGVYFLVRSFCTNTLDVMFVARMTALLLMPVAAAMLYEKQGFANLFASVGGGESIIRSRDGAIRAVGASSSATQFSQERLEPLRYR